MTSDRYKTVLLFGGPGTGKGTQGKMLGQIPGFHHVSSGDLFRSLNPNSNLGRTFAEYSSKGLLVPDDLTIRMWREHMAAQEVLSIFRPDQQLLVLDGIPRNVYQAKVMDERIEVLLVLHLTCAEPARMFERLRKRALKEKRTDDAREEVIRNRWKVYEDETRPVLEHYPQGMIRTVEALGSPAGVLARILGHVVPVQEKHFGNVLG